jgi:hypothetical protein
MKATLTSILIICLLMLGACAKSRTIDYDTFDKALMSLSFDTSLMMFNAISETEDGPLDRILWLDQREETEIKIHLMTNSSNPLFVQDQKILITNQFIYRTPSMTKEMHGINTSDPSQIDQLILQLSPIYDVRLIRQSALLEAFLLAESITTIDTTGTRTYRGTYLAEDDLEGTYTAWSVTYDKSNNVALSVMRSRHYDRPSTYQVSNMIESYSVFFNEPFPFEFPDLSLF